MLATITRMGFSTDATPAQLRSARDYFDRHNYLQIPGFLDPAMLRIARRFLRGAAFKTGQYGVGRDLKLYDDPLASVFLVLLNDPKLFRLIRRITGCGPVGCFAGRLYRMVARSGQSFEWHNDVMNDRMVAISINLSDTAYRGGTLQIRDTSGSACEAIPNLGFGDAIIFRVADHLEHRVTPVVGNAPKTAVTGWFCSRPKYTSVHRAMVSRSEAALANRAVGKRKGVAVPSPHDVAKIPDAVVSHTTGRATFVANVATAMCFGLNATGTRVWELLAEGRAMRSIADTVARDYGVARREVERDVLALAQQLAQRDLIKVVPARL
jgi:hypothetical protein